MLEKGTLVRVKDAALSPASEHLGYNTAAVEDHGKLWIFDREDDFELNVGKYVCRSLTTGKEKYWYLDELEVAGDAQA